MGQNYYIFKSGRLHRKAHTLYFIDTDGKRTVLPVENVDALWIFGTVRFHSRFLTFLARKQIPVHIFNFYGFYSGSFLPRRRTPSGWTLIQQARAYLDPNERRHIASEIVHGAVFHMARLLREYTQKDPLLQATIDKLRAVQTQIETCTTVDQLRAVEGQARRYYYQVFHRITPMAEYPFVRTRRPPRSPLNAMLSFAGTLLYPVILQEIYHTPLDPSISYLHEPGERRFSLALDFADIFRPLIVEPTVLRLVNRRQMQAEDFEPVERGIFLTELGRKKVLQAIEETLTRTVHHRRLRRKVSYRQIIRIEAYKLVRHLVGDEPYRAFRAWW